MRTQLSWVRHAAQATARGAGVSVRGALLSIEELTKKIGFQYSKFLDANREWEAKNLALALPSHTLRVHLSKAIGTLLPKRVRGAPSPRLAVFIDDLDRCEPEAAYRLLEGLKIYLALDNCVFVLGMNQKAVEGAIGSRMDARQGNAVIANAASEEGQTEQDIQRQVRRQLERQTRSRAAAYMEKLCQNIWRLPAVRDPRILEQGPSSQLSQVSDLPAAGSFVLLITRPARVLPRGARPRDRRRRRPPAGAWSNSHRAWPTALDPARAPGYGGRPGRCTSLRR